MPNEVGRFGVGVTATRDGLTVAQVDRLIELLSAWNPDELHHGDCVGGDADAAGVADGLGIATVSHPPTNPKLRAFHLSTRKLPPEEYKARNRAIVHATAVLVALPKSDREESYGGTWGTVRYARDRGRPLFIVYPDGRVAAERVRDPRLVIPGAGS